MIEKLSIRKLVSSEISYREPEYAERCVEELKHEMAIRLYEYLYTHPGIHTVKIEYTHSPVTESIGLDTQITASVYLEKVQMMNVTVPNYVDEMKSEKLQREIDQLKHMNTLLEEEARRLFYENLIIRHRSFRQKLKLLFSRGK